MQPYQDLEGESGISAYEIGPGFIRVQFKHGGIYLYTTASAGAQNLASMQALASSGDGLNTFINRYVRWGYARKER